MPLPLLQDQYERALTRWLEECARVFRRALEPALERAAPRMDADVQLGLPLGPTLQLLQAMAPTLVDPVQARALVWRMGWSAAAHHKQTTASKLLKALKPGQRARIERIDIFGLEPWLEPALETWTQQNVALITAMPGDMLAEAAKLVQQAVPSGMRHETLAKRLKASLEVPEWRAKLIARDQTAKWNAALTTERFRSAGIRRFRWRTARDRRVVGTPGGAYPVASSPSKHGNHYEREGRLFLVGQVPLVEVLPDGRLLPHPDWNDGQPGEGIQCRCWAEPSIEGLEDLLDNTPVPVSMGGG